MEIQKVNNQNFTANNDYNRRSNRRANIDGVIALDDNTIRKIAYAKTVNTVEDKKHKNITKAILWSAPIAAGIGTALLVPSKSSILNKQISGIAGRLLNGAKTTAVWTGILGTVSAVIGAKHLIEKKSEAAKDFDKNNPLLSALATFAVGLGTVALGINYLPKAYKAVLKHINPKSLVKFENSAIKKANKFNDLKFVRYISKQANALKNNKHLEPLKAVAKTALDWAPSVLIWGSMFHAIDHAATKNREFNKNYSQMKDFQKNLAQVRIRELSMENDFLLQDEKNREALRLLKHPTADLPDEVKEKLANLH